ncbi:S26 family signal peptidase [Streptomyces sp. NPDC098101]|uniref:S26 family signal peptidase n=1 Tax=Streptomyces sp. NPDC098101 TaxID=3366096 RepID=UPI003803C8A5
MSDLTAAALPVLAVLGLAAGLLAAARRALLVVTVRGGSMTPALAPGDRILVLRRPARGLRDRHIVVLRSDRIPAAGRDDLLVKRIAAAPGAPVPSRAGGRGTVPDGHFVVLGDNPALSTDSRVWGPVPADSVVGVMIGRVARGGHRGP